MDRGRQVKCLSHRGICTPPRTYPGITGVPVHVVLFYGGAWRGGSDSGIQDMQMPGQEIPSGRPNRKSI